MLLKKILKSFTRGILCFYSSDDLQVLIDILSSIFLIIIACWSFFINNNLPHNIYTVLLFMAIFADFILICANVFIVHGFTTIDLRNEAKKVICNKVLNISKDIYIFYYAIMPLTSFLFILLILDYKLNILNNALHLFLFGGIVIATAFPTIITFLLLASI